jgi:hypothetical protein
MAPKVYRLLAVSAQIEPDAMINSLKMRLRKRPVWKIPCKNVTLGEVDASSIQQFPPRIVRRFLETAGCIKIARPASSAAEAVLPRFSL